MKYFKSYAIFENKINLKVEKLIISGLLNAIKNNKTDMFFDILKKHPMSIEQLNNDMILLIIEASFNNNQTIIDYIFDNYDLDKKEMRLSINDEFHRKQKEEIGDLLFFESQGKNGLLGLVVNDNLYEDDEFFLEYEKTPMVDVYFRGHGGDRMEINLESETVFDLFSYDGSYFRDAMERGDISAYISISKKENLTLKKEYIVMYNYINLTGTH